MSTSKIVYSSINDGDDSGEIRFSKNLKSRLKNFLRKKENSDGNDNDHNKKQKATTSDESLTLSGSVTDEESPIKQQQNDNESFDMKFDRYFASSFLPSDNNTDNDMDTDIDDRNNNNHNDGLHRRAFVGAKEMKFPPPPPQQVRVRKQIPCYDRYTLSKAGGNYIDDNIVLPTNLSPTFQNEVEAIQKTNDEAGQNDSDDDIILPTNLSSTFQNKVEAIQKTNDEIGKQQPTSCTLTADSSVSVSVKDDNTNQSQEPFKDNMNAAINLVTFGDDLIHTVDENQSELYSMFEMMKTETKRIKLMNPCSHKGVTAEEVGIDAAGNEDAKEVNKIHMTVIDESRSLEGKSKGNKSNMYQQADDLSKLLKSKVGSIRKKLSTIAAETNCREHLCSILDCAESCNTTAYDDFAADTSTSPLDHSWLSYNNDSDSVSKLTAPHDLNLSHSLEIYSILESTNDNFRAMAGKRFDF